MRSGDACRCAKMQEKACRCAKIIKLAVGGECVSTQGVEGVDVLEWM